MLESRQLPPDIKAANFDNDNTFYPTRRAVKGLYRAVSAAYGLPIPDQVTIDLAWNHSFTETVNAIWQGQLKPEQLKAYAAERNFSIAPYPYTRKALRKLKSMGLIIGVVSSGDRSFMNKLHERLRLGNNFFYYVQGQQDHPNVKPDPRVFDRVICLLEERGIHEDQTVYVDDHYSGIVAARARGMYAIGVTTGMTPFPELMDHGADIVVPSVAHVPDLIRKARELGSK